jgi:Amt family ammonium transporter
MFKKLVLTLAIFAIAIGVSGMAFAQDPSGAETLAQNPNSPVDYVWVLVCGFLVFFMQAGFAMVEAGFCRAKNATNLMAKNTIDFTLASLIFMAFGFAFMMGNDYNGIIGTSGWLLHGDNYDVGRYLLFFWQLVFAGPRRRSSRELSRKGLNSRPISFTVSGDRTYISLVRTLGLGRRLAFKTAFRCRPR